MPNGSSNTKGQSEIWSILRWGISVKQSRSFPSAQKFISIKVYEVPTAPSIHAGM